MTLLHYMLRVLIFSNEIVKCYLNLGSLVILIEITRSRMVAKRMIHVHIEEYNTTRCFFTEFIYVGMFPI